MNWNRENTLSFISIIRERPVVWDATLPHHKIKNKRNDAMEEVAKRMGISRKEASTKWTSLRGQYKREWKRNGDIPFPRDSVSTKWFAYDEMADLMPCNVSGTPDSFSNDEVGV